MALTSPHGDWPNTVWSAAWQITALLDWPRAPGDGVSPPRFFAGLRAAGHDIEAAQFLGLALPRYEAVAWAARVVTSYPLTSSAEARTMRAVEDWLREPSDALRRLAAEVSTEIRNVTPARLCAAAAFMSGGSVYPVGERPVPTPRQTTGKLVAGAILTAVYQTDEPAGHLDAALNLGAAIAAQATDLSQ
ncbi:hypothetical protein PX554_06950 [Sphingomonas sp. H39-1-10]|uniref:DUF6931 family protein n=1 Tax=Sphingomonas pollutisoli TaxID=3030829 RepID=UPI0023B92AD9|nr:hypothetical protein [Sphingomonas pollutisoli]MDF0487862.1 hypothetical protein [Sphingomonas pollutisoli]